jgi:hypothetical protein
MSDLAPSDGSASYAITCRDAIWNVFGEAGQPLSLREAEDRVEQMYPVRRWLLKNVRLDIKGSTVNHPSRRHHPSLSRRAFLFRQDDGKYRLWNQETDGDWLETPEGVERLPSIHPIPNPPLERRPLAVGEADRSLSRKFWRMSLRVGNQGHSMWEECLRWGVAAITYAPLAHIDLSKYPEEEPQHLWNQLEPTQKASLRRVAYEMEPGDVIYVKEGSRIMDRGLVIGRYRFDTQARIKEPSGTPWAHQVAVEWSQGSFPQTGILLGAEQLTVKELTDREVEQIETAALGERSKGASPSQVEGPIESAFGALAQDPYFRECPARLKVIVPLHNRLSNEFCTWLDRNLGVKATQEREWVDIRFTFNRKSFIAELKVCFGAGVTKSIREALGQLLEYNHYPSRIASDEWMIILDHEPSEADRMFVAELRGKRSFPLTLGWRRSRGFAFDPRWPA